jgi:hypothetical protein
LCCLRSSSKSLSSPRCTLHLYCICPLTVSF